MRIRYDECPNQFRKGFSDAVFLRSVLTEGTGAGGDTFLGLLKKSFITLQKEASSAIAFVFERFWKEPFK
jgi:hypothetical protein